MCNKKKYIQNLKVVSGNKSYVATTGLDPIVT